MFSAPPLSADGIRKRALNACNTHVGGRFSRTRNQGCVGAGRDGVERVCPNDVLLQ